MSKASTDDTERGHQWVAEELGRATAELPTRRHPCRCGRPLPSTRAVADIVKALRDALFPGHFGNDNHPANEAAFAWSLENLQSRLAEQIHRGLCFAATEENVDDCAERSDCALSIAKSFFAKLPAVRRLLNTDVEAAYYGDPAATATDETILCYPGILAMINYRLARELYVLHVPFLPRMITERAHSETGIDIHPGAVIGEGFFIDHGTGVVIGETCIIGKRVRLYQGVTLGAKSFPLDQEGNPVKGIDRHPIVEDEVIIYSGATILGRVVIGKGSVIGGNVWLTHGVPAGSRVSQAEVVQDVFDRGGGI